MVVQLLMYLFGSHDISLSFWDLTVLTILSAHQETQILAPAEIMGILYDGPRDSISEAECARVRPLNLLTY